MSELSITSYDDIHQDAKCSLEVVGFLVPEEVSNHDNSQNQKNHIEDLKI